MFRMTRVLFFLLAVSSFCLSNLVYASECSVAQPHPLTEEQLAQIRGDLQQAETLYRQKVSQQPKNYELAAGLVRTLLEEQKVDEADSTVKSALAAAPQSVELLTAQAEVQYREGIPWDMEKTLQAAQQVDVCYPRVHLVLARYFRFNSYHASALKEIKLAHQLDPYDPDIRRVWLETLPLKQRIEELKAYLAAKDDDADGLRRSEHELVYLEDRANRKMSACHLASPMTSTEIPFAPILDSAQHIRAWGLDVNFNDHRARLGVDTGASGLYVSRSVAEHAGLKPVTRIETGGIGNGGEQGGYLAYADSIKVGNLEFRNCLVEVSDRRNIVDLDGLIGMNVFSSFLVTLDFPWRKLTLGPLPPYPETVAPVPTLNTEEGATPETSIEDSQNDASASARAAPATQSGTTSLPSQNAASPARAHGPHDRYIAPEMKDWTSAYRVGHNMIVPTALNHERLRLFVIDTGAFRTSISPSAAREVTKVHSDPRMRLRGVSGTVSDVYSGDKIVFRFAHLEQEHENVPSFDLSGVSKGTGVEISGLIGFDMLGLLVVKIDYRDGLMDFQYSADRGYQHIR